MTNKGKTMGRGGRFQVSVSTILENRKTGKILLLKNAPTSDTTPGAWRFISGRIKQFEDIKTALKREINEETSFSKIEIVKPIDVSHTFRGGKNAENELIGITYWCLTDEEKVKLSREHSDYRWCETEEAAELVGEKGINQAIQAYLKERQAYR